jgi:5'-deoxynucleotidase YfbR-like HD superfamily hydrolase
MQMMTYSGNQIDLNNFTEKDINLIDIAVSLSRQNRYLGHSMYPFSVGQHSIFSAMIAQALGDSEDMQHFAIIHDAHEFAFQDIIRPVSASFPNTAWQAAKDNADHVIFKFFNCSHLLQDESKRNRMKTIDHAAIIIERICLFPAYNWDTDRDNVAAPVRKVVDTLIDLNFKIPHDLLVMTPNKVAENLHEVLAVIHFEKTTNTEIDVNEGLIDDL